MKCPGEKDWHLLAMQILEADQAESMLSHAHTCSPCRARFEAARRDHIERVRTYEAFDRDHDVRREQLMAALPDELPRPAQAGRTTLHWRRLGDSLMNPNTTHRRGAAALLLTAACIAVACLIVLTPGQTSAFAAAIQHLKQAQTIVCRVTKTTTARMQPDPQADPAGIDPAILDRIAQAPETTGVLTEMLYSSTQHGVRRDVHEGEVLLRMIYVSPHVHTVLVNPPDRTYQRFDAEEENRLPVELQEAIEDRPLPDIHFFSPPNDPDHLIRGLRNLTADADRELGRDTFNGRDAIGYEISGEKVGFGPPWTDHAEENRAELWVDTETRVVVRLVFRFVERIPSTRDVPWATSMTQTTVYDQFEWDKPLSADWFEPVIPEDYTLLESNGQQNQVKMPDEADLLDAFRRFSDIAGRYPASLNVVSLGQEVAVLAGAIRAKQLVAERNGRTDAQAPDMDALSKLQGLTLFAFLEMTGHEPEYFGESVKPGDADKVLMQWNLDDGNLRIIYGDLRTETVPQTQPGE